MLCAYIQSLKVMITKGMFANILLILIIGGSYIYSMKLILKCRLYDMLLSLKVGNYSQAACPTGDGRKSFSYTSRQIGKTRLWK